MRKVLMTVGLCLLHALAFAQVTPNLQSGSKALLFSFAGLDNLNANSFNGGIGGKYYLSPTLAVRGGIQLAKGSLDRPANAAAGVEAQDGERSGTTVGFSAALELHSGSRRVNPFIGAGAAFSSTSTEDIDPNIGPASQQRIVKNDPNGEPIGGTVFFPGTRVDVFGLLGAEFFIVKELSLAAEYRLGFSNISGKDFEVIQGTSSTVTKVGGTTGFGVTTAGVLTLAFYF
jgi:hypothetical protein